jgi:hypothetical protein
MSLSILYARVFLCRFKHEEDYSKEIPENAQVIFCKIRKFLGKYAITAYIIDGYKDVTQRVEGPLKRNWAE